MGVVIRHSAILLILGIIFLLPIDLFADEKESNGVINGDVINGTTGDRVSGVEVILKRYEGDQEKDQQKRISDSQGKFYFNGLDRRKGNSYILQIIYKKVEYYGPPIVFEDQKRMMPLKMTVYETTDSDEKISVTMHHVVIELQDGALIMKEMMILENHDNKVYVGSHEIAPEKKETLRISLPPKAQELQLLSGLMEYCIVQLQDGFADTMDIKPGRKEIRFAYKVDYRTSSLNLTKKINLKTDSLDFFIPDQGIRAEGEKIEYAGLVGQSEKQFLHFSGKKLTRGSQVVLNLKGLPWGGKLFKKIVPVLALIILGLGFIYPLIRRRIRYNESKMKAEDEPVGKSTPQEERQNILRAIAELDDQLDFGQISPEVHEEKRRVLKERALEVTRTLGSE